MRSKKYSKQDIVDALKYVDEICEGDVTTTKYKRIRKLSVIDNKELPSYSVVHKRLGFRHALEIAGLKTNSQKNVSINSDKFCKYCIEQDCSIDLEDCEYYKEGVIDAC